MAAELTKISDNARPIRKVADEVVARSRIRPGFQGNPFAIPQFPPGVMKAVERAGLPTLAQDEVVSNTLTWAAQDPIAAAYAEGIVFLGYSYLSVLAQRAEYRVVSETISSEMTREWIELKIQSGDESKQDTVKAIEDEMDKLDIRRSFRKVAEADGFFGRGHLYLDTGMTDDHEELLTDVGNGRSQMSRLKLGPNKPQKLIDVRPVEPAWAYPTNYESIDPLRRDWYKPLTWYVMAREIHHSRFLTFVGREVPDILKPAYAFGGLAMSQMLKPYVDNWLRTRQSVSDLVQNFSVNVLKTNMDATTAVGGDALYNRVALFNNVKNNQGTMVLDKDSEDWANVSTPIGGLDSLQAQAQEHMAAISRIPLVKLLGIQPAGLNASSEGELIAFEDWIAAFQELLFRKHLTTIIDMIQLSKFGKIEQDITFDFKPLRQLKPEDLANLEATKATTRETYFGMGAVDANEIRETLAEDPDSPFEGLDLSKPLPPPPAPPQMPGMAPGPPGPPGRPGGPPPPPGAPPPGGSAGPPPPGGGAANAPDAAAPSSFPSQLTQALNSSPAPWAFDLVAALNTAARKPRLQRPGAQDAEFREDQVKRDEGGKFATQAGGGAAPEQKKAESEAKSTGGVGESVGEKPAPKHGSASSLLAQEYPREVTPERFLSKQPKEVLDKIKQVESQLAHGTPTDASVEQGGFKQADGSWTQERQKIHQDIIAKVLNPEAIEAATPKPGEKPTYTALGGRGGSGKSWFTKSGTVKDGTLVLDNDAIKGMLPEYAGWNAALLHEEASDIFDKIDTLAREHGLNIAHDATLKTYTSAAKRVKAYKDAGYTTNGHYMFVSPDISAQRAMKRFMGSSGRYVPASYILGSTSNESSFDQLQPMLDNWSLHRNDVEGKEPTLVSQKRGDKLKRPE